MPVMDLKQSLIKSILQKLEDILKQSKNDLVMNDFANALKKCVYTKIKKLSAILFHNIEMEPDKKIELITEFRKQLSEKCDPENLDGNEENICLSSDDDIDSHLSSSSSLIYTDEEPNVNAMKANLKNGLQSDDSDIEIIYEKESDNFGNGTNRYNMRKRRVSDNVQDGPIYKQSRYDFRNRKPDIYSESSAPNMPNGNEQPGESKKRDEKPKESEVIQIEDSSSDEDVQEIRRESGTSNNARFSFPRANRPPNNQPKPSFRANYHRHYPPTQPDPSQLASIPLVVQFPSMQSATFNGHLYISHNHKFSVKLQGVDPTNFRWN